MFTNYDAQKVLSNKSELRIYLETLKDINSGLGSTEIHLWALKQLLEEVKACRQ